MLSVPIAGTADGGGEVQGATCDARDYAPLTLSAKRSKRKIS
jgi:hypothetical protein